MVEFEAIIANLAVRGALPSQMLSSAVVTRVRLLRLVIRSLICRPEVLWLIWLCIIILIRLSVVAGPLVGCIRLNRVLRLVWVLICLGGSKRWRRCIELWSFLCGVKR